MRTAILAVFIVLSVTACAKKETSETRLCKVAGRNYLRLIYDRNLGHIENYASVLAVDPGAAKEMRDEDWAAYAKKYDMPEDITDRWDRFQDLCEEGKWAKDEVTALVDAKDMLDLIRCDIYETDHSW